MCPNCWLLTTSLIFNIKKHWNCRQKSDTSCNKQELRLTWDQLISLQLWGMTCQRNSGNNEFCSWNDTVYCWKAVRLTYCKTLDKWGVSVLEILCLQMSNRSNDCSNIIGNHQECFQEPAKCLHPVPSNLPDCEALAVDLIFTVCIYFSFSVTCLHSNRCTVLFQQRAAHYLAHWDKLILVWVGSAQTLVGV